MNKSILTILAILVIFTGIGLAFFIEKPQKKEIPKNIETNIVKESEENTVKNVEKEKYSVNKIEQISGEVNTSMEEEKLSPNAVIIFKTKYIKCGHEKEEFLEIPEQMVNKTKEEMKNIYSDWKIENFNKDKIILKKEKEGECGEHYKVKEKDNRVAIYEILEDNTEREYEVTDISTEYMTNEDRKKLNSGIQINGKAKLNQYIEDFE